MQGLLLLAQDFDKCFFKLKGSFGSLVDNEVAQGLNFELKVVLGLVEVVGFEELRESN